MYSKQTTAERWPVLEAGGFRESDSSASASGASFGERKAFTILGILIMLMAAVGKGE